VDSDEPIRVWSAGCATGEETYTTVMLLVEALGEERFKRHVKLYATDMDEPALEQARMATFTENRMESVPDELREKYFVQGPTGWTFRNDLRRCVIFGRHDLLADAPISRLDLLICRNTLIYFNAEAQSRILTRFNFGLKHAGALFLGKAEMLLTHSRLFTPVDMAARIFRKAAGPDLRERLAISGTTRPRLVRIDPPPTLIANARGELRSGTDIADHTRQRQQHPVGELAGTQKPEHPRARYRQAHPGPGSVVSPG
jgi:two-component system, chemotaxis family, CheB/CheR fusion protein